MKWTQELGGDHEGKKSFKRPRNRQEDDIKMNVQQIGWSGVDRIDLAQYRDSWRDVVREVMNIRVP